MGWLVNCRGRWRGVVVRSCGDVGVFFGGFEVGEGVGWVKRVFRGFF